MSKAFDLSQFKKQANTVNLSVTGNTALSVLSANTVSATDVAASSFNSGPLGGMRNVLINALGTINQRGYSSGAATSGANQYTVDRWRVVTSGENLSWTESENVRTFTAPAGGVEQVVEGLNIQSGTYVISFTGTATCTVGGVTKVSGDTVTLTGGTNVTVRFSGGTFSKPQLEPGTKSTPFESRPIGTELALCQRYYQVVAKSVGIAASATAVEFGYQYPVQMRTSPTLTTTGALQVEDPSIASYTQSSSAVINQSANEYGAKIIISNFSGLITARPYIVGASSAYNGNTIRADAEL